MKRELPFSSTLGPVLRGYIDLKRALGRKFFNQYQVLHSLDRFLSDPAHSWPDLTFEAFRRWCYTQQHLASGMRRSAMQMVYNFCLYRRRTEPDYFVPDPSFFPLPHQRIRPYIVSESDVARLLLACADLRRISTSPLRREVVHLAIALLYTTGMRHGELLKLTVSDYDSKQGTLLIRESKFHKSRLLPLHPDMVDELNRYLQLRRTHRLPMSPETPLIWNSIGGGRAYSERGLGENVRILLDRCNIRTAQGKLPRVHDFRHGFAVNALIRWYRKGVDVNAKLPFLATYLGHVSIASTYYYYAQRNVM